MNDSDLILDPKDTAESAVILVGRGSLYSRQPEEELAILAASLRSSNPKIFVVEALLEQGRNSLSVALDACAKIYMPKAVVFPVFIPVEAATRNWLQFVARRWLKRTGSPLEITFAETLAWQSIGISAVNDLITRANESGKPLSVQNLVEGHFNGDESDPDWSVIPPHSYHVLFCQGPRCTAAGAGELGSYLRKRLREKRLEDGPDQVLAARTSCLYPCNLGPLMLVYPEGTWYCGLDEEAVDQIIEDHFIDGQTVDRYAHRPTSQRQTLSSSTNPYS